MQPIISIQGLAKTYAGGFQALKGVDLEIRKGEIFALLGPNGAGKTTLIGIVCGLVRMTGGKVTADGHDIQKDFRAARTKIGLVPQEISTDAFEKVWDTVKFSRGLFGKPPNDAHLEKVLKDLSLWDKRNEKIMALSGGMKRRVMIAKALSHEPTILFLDEPTAGVDVELRQTLWQFVARLNKQGSTVLLTTHYLEEAEALCSRIAMLKLGKVIALDRTSELLKSAASNVLRFKTDAMLPWAIAQHARITGRIVQLPAQNAHEVEQLLAAIREAGVTVEDVEMRKADLEDVFIDLMAGEQTPLEVAR